MKLDFKYTSVIALSLATAFSALSMQGQTAKNPSDNGNQSEPPAAVPATNAPNPQAGASSTGASQPQGESLADRARKAKAASHQTPGGAKPKVFNQDNLSSAKKTSYSKPKPKRNGLKKIS